MSSRQTNLRNIRSMPQWVNENHTNVGPKPPPPPIKQNGINDRPPPLPRKNQPDPDYEIIEFGQQYSNAAQTPKKTDLPKKSGIKCELCGSTAPTVRCEECPQHLFCSSCDDMYHRHPKRQTHTRKYIDMNYKPPLPPKGEGSAPNAPLPPPRRNKNKLFSRPLAGLSSVPGQREQVHSPHVEKLQPPPSPALSIREKMGTLKRIISPSSRPLPPPPPPERSQIQSQTLTRPPQNSSPFDTIRRAPSLTMEKIQNQTTAALDRMSQLQQRYRQHQEAMRSDSDRSRRTSNASDIDIQMKLDQLRMRQQAMPTNRNLSSSVMDLNSINSRPAPQMQWTTNPMQQAQSMAQLHNSNLAAMQWQQQQQQPHWSNQFEQSNGSNMSLNLPPSGYFYPQAIDNRPPPVWMNTWGAAPMYPYPVGMVPVSPMPMRRPSSRNQSRAASPALSLRSRRSAISNRNASHRNSYTRDLTDDEDSDLSDHELNMRSNRPRRDSQSQKGGTLTRRSRKNSSSADYDNESELDRERHLNRTSDLRTTKQRQHSFEQSETETRSPPPVQPPLPPKKETVIQSPVVVQLPKPPAPAPPVQPETIYKPKQIEVKQQQPALASEDEDIDEDDNEEDVDEEEEPTATTTMDVEDLGPPPPPPDHEWECEHCTFVNEANIKICIVCCKTPTQKPKPSVEVKTKTVTPVVPQKSVQPKLLKSTINKDVKKSSIVAATAPSVTANQNTLVKNETAYLKKPSPSISKTTTTSEESSSDAGKVKDEIPDSKMNGIHESDTDNESSDIEFDGEKPITEPPKKVSSGCGPSPPRESTGIGTSDTEETHSKQKSPSPIKNIKTKNIPKNVPETKSISTGTSPPPQDMSTQTYDTLPLKKISEPEENYPPKRPLSAGIRRSRSLASRTPMMNHTDFNLLRSHSRQSFSSESQSFEMTPDDLSSPPFTNYDDDHDILNDDAIAYINRTLNQNREPSKYKSSGDLRRHDSHRSRKLSMIDLHHHQQQQQHKSQRTSIKSPDEFTIEDIVEMKRQKSLGPSGMELIRLLREAEQYKFTAEDLQAALSNCGNSNPIIWLRENWHKLIETVQTLATKYGHEKRENTIGTISNVEAREALRFHKGNVWHAVTDCIEQRQKKYNEIAARGIYTREDIVSSLTAHRGNVEMAQNELAKLQLKPFLMRIWEPPAGADNESGNLFLMEQFNREQEIDGEPQSQEMRDFYEKEFGSKPIPDSLVSPMSGSSLISEKKDNSSENDVNSDLYYNSNLLHDIETLIGNMEQNQAKQNENMLKNIEQLLGTVLAQQKPQKIPSDGGVDSRNSTENMHSSLDAFYEPLNRKSPIVIPNNKGQNQNEHTDVNNDVRNFVSMHIQDIVPDVVDQVQQQLRDENEFMLILPSANNITNDSIKKSVDRNDPFPFEDQPAEENDNKWVENSNHNQKPSNNELKRPLSLSMSVRPHRKSSIKSGRKSSKSSDPKYRLNHKTLEELNNQYYLGYKTNDITNLSPENHQQIEEIINIQTETKTTTDQLKRETPQLQPPVQNIEVRQPTDNEIHDARNELKQRATEESESIQVIEEHVMKSNEPLKTKILNETPQNIDIIDNVNAIASEKPLIEDENKIEQVISEDKTVENVIQIEITTDNQQNASSNTRNSNQIKHHQNAFQPKTYKIQSLPKKRNSKKKPISNILSPKIQKNRFSLEPHKKISNEMNTKKLDDQLEDNHKEPEINTIANEITIQKEIHEEIVTTVENPITNEETKLTEQIKIAILSQPDHDSSDEDVYVDSKDNLDQSVVVNVDKNPKNAEEVNNLNQSPLIRQSQNLSDLVNDTQRLIKQMKDEIASDIASMVSEEEDFKDRSDDDEETQSYDWTDDSGEDGDSYDDEEELEDGEEEIHESGDGEEDEEWIDVSSNYESEEEREMVMTEHKHIPQIDFNEHIDGESHAAADITDPDEVNISFDAKNDIQNENKTTSKIELKESEQIVNEIINDIINQEIKSGNEEISSLESPLEGHIDETALITEHVEQIFNIAISEIENQKQIVPNVNEIKSEQTIDHTTQDIQNTESNKNLVKTNENKESATNEQTVTVEEKGDDKVVIVTDDVDNSVDNLMNLKYPTVDVVSDTSIKNADNLEIESHAITVNNTENLPEPIEESHEKIVLVKETQQIPYDGKSTQTNISPVKNLKENEIVVDLENPTTNQTSIAVSTENVHPSLPDEIQPENVSAVAKSSEISNKPSESNNIQDGGDIITNEEEISNKVQSTAKQGAIRKIPVRKRSLTNAPVLPAIKTNSIANIQNKIMSNFNDGNKRPTIQQKSSLPTSKNLTNAKTPPVSKTSSFIKTLTNKISKTMDQKTTPPTTINNNKPTISSSTNTSNLSKSRVTTRSESAKMTELKNGDDVHKKQTDFSQQKIPKKKYVETCFSDNYETSDEETSDPKIETLVEKKQFYQISKSFDVHDELLNEGEEKLIKQFLNEGKVQTIQEAELVVCLMQMKFDVKSALWATSQCSSLDHAISILQQECELCMEKVPMNEIISMLKCTHQCCKKCAKNYFSIQITERAITDCTCPFCKLPELHDPDISSNEVIEYFSNLDILLKNILSVEDHELFQRKLRDRTLMEDPNFKWCVDCSSGWFISKKQKVLVCPDCESRTCASCRKPWEDQHKGITCEQFAEWKQLNDPETQNEGVMKHLQLNGIQCPKCKFQYSLTRGGCIHFTCLQCKYEFCYGCGKPFVMAAKCPISNVYCAKLGLHAHHPRNCLFYLRDKEPHQLQKLLRMNNVSFDTEPLAENKIEKSGVAYAAPKCPIGIQKDVPTLGYVDTVCNGDVIPNNAGLCRDHYVEYLVNRVRKEKIDPLPILDLTDCWQELRRHGIPLPERGPWDTDEIYREMCIKTLLNDPSNSQNSELKTIPDIFMNKTIDTEQTTFIKLQSFPKVV